MKIPVYEISIPEYHVKSEPNSKLIGKKIDDIIKKHFIGRKLAIRGLGSQEHKGKSQAEIIEIIKKLGTDRYDSKRKGDRYENLENKKIDFFAIDRLVKKKSRIIEYLIHPFYKYPPLFGRVPVKVDIIILYDLDKLKRIVYRGIGRKDYNRDGFVFKNPENKSDAILGVIKIK